MNVTDHTRFCPVCGKRHYPCDLDDYVYKRIVKTPKKETLTLYFCSWTCLRKWDKDEEGRKNAIAKRETYIKTGEERCGDCRYCVRGKYGFIDCTVYSRPTNPEKKICRRFKPQYDYQESICAD